MDHLAGWTIAVTSNRRADEQAELLQRRGAEVVLAPLVDSARVPEQHTRDATAELLRARVEILVATTGVGMRSWLAMSWTWGMGDALLDALRRAEVYVRGAKTHGALASEDIPSAWRAGSEGLTEMLEALVARGVAGRRVGVQLHGGDTTWFTDALRTAGAEVIAVPVYRVRPSGTARTGERLTSAVGRGELDAITVTSAAAVEALTAVDGLVSRLRRAGVAVGCTGAATAKAAQHAGLTELVVADPQRLGSMVRALGLHLERRGRTLEVGGTVVRHQGSCLSVDGSESRLTPRERRLLEVLLATDGAVLSKDRLAATAWDAPVDAHTVEVAVNRLRRKLGPAAVALETTNRRGYRIAV